MVEEVADKLAQRSNRSDRARTRRPSHSSSDSIYTRPHSSTSAPSPIIHRYRSSCRSAASPSARRRASRRMAMSDGMRCSRRPKRAAHPTSRNARIFLLTSITRRPTRRRPSGLGYIRLDLEDVCGFNHAPRWETLLRDPALSPRLRRPRLPRVPARFWQAHRHAAVGASASPSRRCASLSCARTSTRRATCLPWTRTAWPTRIPSSPSRASRPYPRRRADMQPAVV